MLIMVTKLKHRSDLEMIEQLKALTSEQRTLIVLVIHTLEDQHYEQIISELILLLSRDKIPADLTYELLFRQHG